MCASWRRFEVILVCHRLYLHLTLRTALEEFLNSQPYGTGRGPGSLLYVDFSPAHKISASRWPSLLSCHLLKWYRSNSHSSLVFKPLNKATESIVFDPAAWRLIECCHGWNPHTQSFTAALPSHIRGRKCFSSYGQTKRDKFFGFENVSLSHPPLFRNLSEHVGEHF